MREIGLPFSILSFCPFVKYDPTSFNTFIFQEASMIIIPDPNNFPIPVDAIPERAPFANGAATLGKTLRATGINPRTRSASVPKIHHF